MSFLNPVFLLALAAIAVPLLIYLWNVRKPKRVKFSTLTFFNSLKSSSLRKIKIKRWLLLAIRTLTVTALAIALAQPFLPSDLGVTADGEPKVVGIVIDNSPSMNQVDRNGPYFEQALEVALEIIDLQSRDDRIQLNVTNGPPLRSSLLSPAVARGDLSAIEVFNAGNYLRENLMRTAQIIGDAPEPNKEIYLITDGQESQLDPLREIDRDEPFSQYLQIVKVGNAEPANVGFDDVEISTDDGNVHLNTRLRNFGEGSVQNQFLSLFVDGELIVQQPYTLDGGAVEEFNFTLPETDQTTIPIELLIEGDELTFDNRYYAAVNLPESRELLVVERSSESGGAFRPYLRPMLDAATDQNGTFSADYVPIGELTPDQFADYDAVVLNGVQSVPDYLAQPLMSHVQGGAGLLLLPSADGDINNYNQLLGLSDAGRYRDVVGSYGSFNTVDRLATPEEGHPILEELFEKQEDEEIRLNVPEIFYYYDIEPGSAELTTPLLYTRTGNIIMNEVRVGSGRMIYSAIGSDPGWSNFPVKPLFAPLFYRTVDYLVSGEEASLQNHTLGEPFVVELPRGTDGNVELEVDDERIIPDRRQTFSGLEIRYEGKEWTPGWVDVVVNGEQFTHAVNQNAMESSLISLSEEELEQMFSSLFDNVQTISPDGNIEGLISELETASFGREIWHWFVILAISLLLLETIISRHYKAETIS